MEIPEFLAFAVPFIIVFYLAALLFVQPSRPVLLASLAGGLIMGGVNIVFDLSAYYTHWWQYTAQDLIFHIPLPLYITPVLIFGSLAYLLIWRFRSGSREWVGSVIFYGVPIFGILRDTFYGLIAPQRSFLIWGSALALLPNILMWVVMFYAGFFVFKLLAQGREHTLQNNVP